VLRGGRLVVACALATVLACGESTLPPIPEALMVVDTDLPVPLAVSRLRVDLYDANGTWFESRDFARPSPADWPASFGVHGGDPGRSTTVYVRVRAYPEGRTRDYRGERFVDWGASLRPPTGDGLPRLLARGADATPEIEPEPLVTVDRIVAVRLEPGRRGAVRVLLAGACVGTMARLGPEASAAPERGLDVAELASCVGAEKEREPVVVARVDENRSIPETRASSWVAADVCAPEESTAERACVPGGVVVLGDRRLLVSPYIASTPERTFRVSSFVVDRREVSVARYRDALARGFSPPRMPLATEGPLGESATDTCSWSAAPRGRENLPLTCVRWATARAFCMFEGGDLPTEAQWEYMAAAAARVHETQYPWGDDAPSCDRAVFERLPSNYPQCTRIGVGPSPVDAQEADATPLGVFGLGGNVSEWVRDSFAEYASPCWSRATVTDPFCEEKTNKRVVRGGSWVSPDLFVFATMRQGHEDHATLSFEGVRCVYPRAAR